MTSDVCVFCAMHCCSLYWYKQTGLSLLCVVCLPLPQYAAIVPSGVLAVIVVEKGLASLLERLIVLLLLVA